MAHELNALKSYRFRIQEDRRQSHRDPAEATRKEKLEGIRQRIDHTFGTLETQVQKVLDDTSLSVVGKQQRLAELKKKVDVSFLTTQQTETQSDIERLHTLLFSREKATGDPVLNFLEGQEYRNSKKDQPLGVIIDAYAQAVKDGHHQRARALTETPIGSLIPQDIKARIDTEHAQQSQPAVFENYKDAQNLKAHLDSLHEHATNVLQALGAA